MDGDEEEDDAIIISSGARTVAVPMTMRCCSGEEEGEGGSEVGNGGEGGWCVYVEKGDARGCFLVAGMFACTKGRVMFLRMRCEHSEHSFDAYLNVQMKMIGMMLDFVLRTRLM